MKGDVDEKQAREREIRERKQRSLRRVKERQVDGPYYRLHYIDAKSLKVDHLKLKRKLLLP